MHQRGAAQGNEKPGAVLSTGDTKEMHTCLLPTQDRRQNSTMEGDCPPHALAGEQREQTSKKKADKSGYFGK